MQSLDELGKCYFYNLSRTFWKWAKDFSIPACWLSSLLAEEADSSVVSSSGKLPLNLILSGPACYFQLDTPLPCNSEHCEGYKRTSTSLEFLKMPGTVLSTQEAFGNATVLIHSTRCWLSFCAVRVTVGGSRVRVCSGGPNMNARGN